MNNRPISNYTHTSHIDLPSIDNKETIIRNLFNKIDYNTAFEYAKKNLTTITKNQVTNYILPCTFASLFNKTGCYAPHSLILVVIHLANLKFGHIKHNDGRLIFIYKELLNTNFINVDMADGLSRITCINDIKFGNKYGDKYKEVYLDYCKYKFINISFENKKFSGYIENGLYKNGKLTNNQKKLILEGEFDFISNEKCQITGKLTNMTNQNVFFGILNNYMPYTGSGEFTYDNGDAFKGVILESKPVEGIMKYINGNIFSGTFNNGNPCKGKMEYNNCNVFDGIFNNGIPYDGETKCFDGSVIKITRDSQYYNIIHGVPFEKATIEKKVSQFIKWFKDEANKMDKEQINEYKINNKINLVLCCDFISFEEPKDFTDIIIIKKSQTDYWIQNQETILTWINDKHTNPINQTPAVLGGNYWVGNKLIEFIMLLKDIELITPTQD